MTGLWRQVIGSLTRKRIGALLFLLLCLLYAFQIPNIQQLPVDRFEAMNARSLPWALSAFGVLCSVALWVLGAPKARSEAAAARNDATDYRVTADVGLVVALLLWIALFAALLDFIGFGLAVWLFLFVGFTLLGERRWTRSAVISTAVALGTWALLSYGLGLYLPAGSLWSSLGLLHV